MLTSERNGDCVQTQSSVGGGNSREVTNALDLYYETDRQNIVMLLEIVVYCK